MATQQEFHRNIPGEKEGVFSKQELFKLHFCQTLESMFQYFPDVYELEWSVKEKFNRPNLELYPKIYLDPNKSFPQILLEKNYPTPLLPPVALAPVSGIPTNPTVGLYTSASSFLLNWHENPKLCTLTIAQDLCNYLEFLEYLIFSLNEFDKEEIHAHIETKTKPSAFYTFERHQFERHRNNFLGEEILFKQERSSLAQELPILPQEWRRNKDKI